MSLHEFAAALQSTSLSAALQSIGWLVPSLQSLHILMIGVVFVSILMVSLRVLGWVRVDEPLAVVWRRFAPFLWCSLAVMALTGVLLTISEPEREFLALSYRLKMLLLVIGVTGAILFGRRIRGAAADARPAAAGARFAAVATVLLWLTIIFLGRAIAYDHEVWGDWSPAVLQRGAAS
jgi:uncharacterized membrane protein